VSNQTSTGRTLADLATYLPSQVVPGLVGFVALPVLTRLFEPEEYGVYSLVRTTVTVLSFFLGWLAAPIQRFYPEAVKEQRARSFRTTVLASAGVTIALVSLLYGVAVALLSPYAGPLLREGLLWALPLFVCAGVIRLGAEFLRARRRIGLFSALAVWRSIAVLGLGCAFAVYLRMGIVGMFAGGVAARLIAIPFLLRPALGGWPSDRSGFSRTLARELARYGIPLTIAGLAAWIMTLSDRYVIQLFRGEKEVGIYSACFSVSQSSMMLIFQLFSLTTGSLLYAVHENEGEEAGRLVIAKLTRLYLLLAVPAAFGLSALTVPLSSILVGRAFRTGRWVIPVIAWAIFLHGLQHRFQGGLNIQKKTHLTMQALLVAAGLNLIGNFLLVPRYGYRAAAYTSLGAFCVLLLLVVLFSRRHYRWPFPWRSLLRCSAAGLLMAFGVWWLFGRGAFRPAQALILGVPFGVVLYGALVVLMGEVKLTEIFRLRNRLH